jgi:hypothetical protein
MIPSYAQFILEGVHKTADYATAARIMGRLISDVETVRGTPDRGALIVSIVRPNDRLIDAIYTMGWFVSVIYAYGAPETIGSRTSGEAVKKVAAMLKLTRDPDSMITMRVEPLRQNYTVAPVGTVLYHVAPKAAVQKILRQGLTPRSKSKITYHPERVYMADVNSICGIARYYSSFIQGGMTLLRVDAAGIKLSADPNMMGAFFTADNVPPSRLRVVDDDFTPDECEIRGWHDSIKKA